jgi:hypothetical protein
VVVSARPSDARVDGRPQPGAGPDPCPWAAAAAALAAPVLARGPAAWTLGPPGVRMPDGSRFEGGRFVRPGEGPPPPSVTGRGTWLAYEDVCAEAPFAGRPGVGGWSCRGDGGPDVVEVAVGQADLRDDAPSPGSPADLPGTRAWTRPGETVDGRAGCTATLVVRPRSPLASDAPWSDVVTATHTAGCAAALSAARFVAPRVSDVPRVSF